MEAESLHINANAKVNLSLQVGEPLENGMHPIVSKMAQIAFFDDLYVTKIDGYALSRYAILWHEDAPRKEEIDWRIQDDLAVRAHVALEEEVGRQLPIQLKIEKRIPIGSGLGGGSSDAASLLRAVTTLYELDVNVHTIAQSLGSDVPFFLQGGNSLVQGTGEEITPMQSELQHLVLIIPDYSCPTAEVYKAFDRLKKPEPGCVNELKDAACDVRPKLRIDIEMLKNLLQQEIEISGSGSTMYTICDNAQYANELARKVKHETSLHAIATQTCSTR